MSNLNESNAIFSEKVLAGKRTYFFDVRETRAGDYYVKITESKKEVDLQGNEVFKKHSVFLYKEDVQKFVFALNKTTDHLKSLLKNYDFDQRDA